MIRTVELSSWSEFEKIVQKQLNYETKNSQTGPFFYRGQPDAAWHLQTTLERYAEINTSVHSYYSVIKRIQPEIETFTSYSWNLPTYNDYIKSRRAMNEEIIIYLQYLRHYGFPSPLLDWTYSPFIAAYFAFRDISNKAQSVAIYQFLAASELWLNSPIIIDPDDINEYAIICPIGTSSQKTKRHYLQQSVYTLCLKKIGDAVCFSSHEDPHIVGTDDKTYSGETITQYVIPASERLIALHSLEAYNINAYSLMGTEESLLETLFLRAYKHRERWNSIYADSPNTKFDIGGP